MALLISQRQSASTLDLAVAGSPTMRTGPQDPAAGASGDLARDAMRGSAQDVYFFTSIEDFPPGIGDLSLTHDDVQGFYDYVRQFNAPNGWYRDGSVGQWIYEETYDNYLDDYGFDAAKVVYHSGHGTMDGNGVFWLPVGNSWGGDTWTSSADMRLGNEYARYVFWSTCLSLRIKGGHTPIRTWSAANLGLRMIFGYETVSVDNGNYGRFFFEEWRKNKSFSTAYLDASWRISTAQEPSVVACGATQAEASSRLFNERYFSSERSSTSWWWWRWYDAARMSARNLAVPRGSRSARLAPQAPSPEAVAAWAERFDVPVPRDLDGSAMRSGAHFEGAGGADVAVGPDGSREVRLAETSDSREQITDDRAIAAAVRAVEQYGLAEDVDLVLDHVRYDRHAGASPDEQVEAAVREVSVGFVQVLDGVPVVSRDGGRLQLRVDNEGRVTGIGDSTRVVEELRDAPAAPPAPASRRSERGRGGPLDPSGLDGDGTRDMSPSDGALVEDALETALQRSLRRASSGGRMPSGARVVPGTTEVGYALRETDAVLVARREVELDFGRGLAKRYVLEEPIDS